MMKGTWTKMLAECADPQQAGHFLELLESTSAGPGIQDFAGDQARVLAALLCGSKALATLLVSHPEWLEVLDPETLKHTRRKQGMQAEVTGWLRPLLEAKDYSAALRRVREFKNREMLRLGARDLAWLSNVPEITSELSNLADVCLSATCEICLAQLSDRSGRPYHQDLKGRWQPTSGCVLGLGKLGGQELNYSSDVDVVFIYGEEGSVFKEPPGAANPPRPAMTSHQFFNKLAESFIAEVSRLAPEGMLYRIDLRLRPEGDSGPLSRSLGSYENYYAQWGQTWERMMLIKARCVAGDKGLAAEFMEMIQPFRYPRSVNESVLHEVAAMKDRIENEVVKAGELDRNVKLGRGGIREIEFIAQSQQLLHGGRQPFLQGAQTLPCLEKLVQYEKLTPEECRQLSAAYHFLRNVEHRLQMDENLQTHTIPVSRPARERLARLMNLGNAQQFEAARKATCGQVRSIFEKIFQTDAIKSRQSDRFPDRFEGREEDWKKLLSEHRFRDVDKAFRVLREFVEGPGYVHVSPRTSELALKLIPNLFALCPGGGKGGGAASEGPPALPGGIPLARERSLARSTSDGTATSDTGAAASPGLLGGAVSAPLSDPDRVVTRLDSFIAAYGARSTLFELWNSNPAIFQLLTLLFDRSEFLAELAIRTPDLVDELVTSGRLRQRKTAAETLTDLRYGLADADQHLWLRRYHQAELMRIGLRDILGLADPEQYLTELSALADACLQYAMEVVLRKNKLKVAPFAIIGLGKLGGAEIDYGSDLDIVFVADSKVRNLQALTRLAIEVTDLVSARTELGIAFHTDARLRPDGEKGILVNTLKAYEDYYRQRALLWELQSLSRTRPVAGNEKIGAAFQSMAAALTNLKQPILPLSAYTPDWKDKVRQMRLRIEKERTPQGKDDLAIKTGAGGLMDAEFLAQALCLENGWHEPNTLKALEKGRDSGVLSGANQLIENYRALRRIEGILRRWSYEGETVLPDDPEPYYRVAIRCGFSSPESFKESLAKSRQAIRAVYAGFF